MQRYEYKVVPAPRKGKRAKGVKGLEARFAHTLSEALNELAIEGWEYLRADTLPVEERSGLTSKHTSFQSLLVFRRPANVAGLIERHDAFTENAFADEDEEDLGVETEVEEDETDTAEEPSQTKS
ncbi:MAG TPA: DUF4177 domain-containing protein [Maritimibacter sp.]|nr:DUF4177 domain-containing protein [Maritimibacter sp.]